MHPYLAQFREEGQRFFKNDCGFRRLEDARRYVALVTDALDWIAEGRVVEARTGACVHHSTGSSAAESHVRAAFGEPQER